MLADFLRRLVIVTRTDIQDVAIELHISSCGDLCLNRQFDLLLVLYKNSNLPRWYLYVIFSCLILDLVSECSNELCINSRMGVISHQKPVLSLVRSPQIMTDIECGKCYADKVLFRKYCHIGVILTWVALTDNEVGAQLCMGSLSITQNGPKNDESSRTWPIIPL